MRDIKIRGERTLKEIGKDIEENIDKDKEVYEIAERKGKFIGMLLKPMDFKSVKFLYIALTVLVILIIVVGGISAFAMLLTDGLEPGQEYSLPDIMENFFVQ